MIQMAGAENPTLPSTTHSGMPLSEFSKRIWLDVISGGSISPWCRCNVCFAPATQRVSVLHKETGRLYEEQFCQDCFLWSMNLFNEFLGSEPGQDWELPDKGGLN